MLQGFAQPGYGCNFFVAHSLSDRFFVSGFTVFLFIQTAKIRFVQTIAPMSDKAMRQDAAVVAAVAIIVGAGERRKNCFQRLRAESGHSFCQTREIRNAEHANDAVAPGLRCQPVDQDRRYRASPQGP